MEEQLLAYQRISTHAPRTGSDRQRKDGLHLAAGFQPTLPARGATMPT